MMSPRPMSGKQRTLRWALFVLLVGGALLVGWRKFQLQSDLLAFLPTDHSAPQLELTRTIMRGPLSRSLVLNIVPKSREQSSKAREIAVEMHQVLKTRKEFERLTIGPAPEFERAVYELYFPHRLQLAQELPGGSAQFWSEAALTQRLAETKRVLSSPASTLFRPLVVEDPLLLFRDRLESLTHLRPQGLELADGQFVAEDGTAFLFARLKPGLDFPGKQRLLKRIETAFATAGGEQGMTLEVSGALPFEVQGERSTRADMARVSAVSIAAIIALSLLFFRSLLPLLLIFLPLLSGVLVGGATTLLVFGEIHGLTLAFGAALLGVGMDYPLHLLNDQALHGDAPLNALHRVRRGLLVGSGTTVAGFSAFAATSSPALLQVACFACAGLLTALLVTTQLLPTVNLRLGPGRFQQRVVEFATAVSRPLTKGRRVFAWGLLLLGLSSAVIVHGACWDSSSEALNPAPLALRQADARVRARLGLTEDMLVMVAPSAEEVLVQAHRLKLRLAKHPGIEQFQSLASLSSPHFLQVENGKAAAAPSAARSLRNALAAEGFSADSFEPALAAMKNPGAPLSLKELLDGPLADIAEPFLLHDDSQFLGLARVKASPDTLEQLATTDAGFFVYSPTRFLEASLRSLTASLRLVLWLGALAMLIIVFLRHRQVGLTALALAPALLGALLALALHSLFVPLHLFHALAALVVLSMGIDYGAFLVESRHEQQAPWPSLLGAALSTMASFGTLALSSVPALKALGGVLFLGILFALLSTPFVATFLQVPASDPK